MNGSSIDRGVLVWSNEFEWHVLKAQTNLAKHGIGFEEAATAFEDKTALALGDVKHSDDEVRSILIGVTLSLKMVTVVHQRRGHRLRIISARRSSQKERGSYDRERRA